MINVNSNAQIVAMYSAQTIAKSSENSNTSDVVQTSAADSASFSPESLKQLEISEFLKNKPVTAYRYDIILQANPTKAEKFITEAMAVYDTQPPSHTIYKNSTNATFKEVDEAAVAMGCTSPEDVPKKTEELYFYRQVAALEHYLEKTQEVKDARLNDKEQYGDRALDFLSARQNEQKLSYPEDWGHFIIYSIEKTKFCDERKIDPDTGQIWLRPINSDTWVTKEEFVKTHPEYLASEEVFKDSQLAKDSTPDIYKKYVSNFINSLNEEQKTFIKDHHLLNDPAYRDLGIEGIAEFTKEYADFDHYYYYDKDAYTVYNSDDYRGDFHWRLQYEKSQQTEYDIKNPEVVDARNKNLQDIGKAVGLTDIDVLNALTFIDFEIFTDKAYTLPEQGDIWKDIFLTNPDGSFKKDDNGNPIRNKDFEWSQEYEYVKNPRLIPDDRELAYIELIKPMKQSHFTMDLLVRAAKNGDLFRYVENESRILYPADIWEKDTTSFDKLYKTLDENEKRLKATNPQFVYERNTRFATLGSYIGVDDATFVKELTNLDLKIFTERNAQGESAEDIWRTMFLTNEDGSFKTDENGKPIRNQNYTYSAEYEYLKGTAEMTPDIFKEKHFMLKKIGAMPDSMIDHYMAYATRDNLGEWVTMAGRF